jgi:hypothetical protein
LVDRLSCLRRRRVEELKAPHHASVAVPRDDHVPHSQQEQFKGDMVYVVMPDVQNIVPYVKIGVPKSIFSLPYSQQKNGVR